jgi:hypothetical protein
MDWCIKPCTGFHGWSSSALSRRLKRWLSLTAGERVLLLRALFVLGLARLSLWTVSVNAARRIVAAGVGSGGATSVERLVWAVKVTSRYVPGATCLTQALALQALLAQAGHESRVEIGVAKNANQLEAHAWVICRNHIVIGGPEIARYSRLAALE